MSRFFFTVLKAEIWVDKLNIVQSVQNWSLIPVPKLFEVHVEVDMLSMKSLLLSQYFSMNNCHYIRYNEPTSAATLIF